MSGAVCRGTGLAQENLFLQNCTHPIESTPGGRGDANVVANMFSNASRSDSEMLSRGRAESAAAPAESASVIFIEGDACVAGCAAAASAALLSFEEVAALLSFEEAAVCFFFEANESRTLAISLLPVDLAKSTGVLPSLLAQLWSAPLARSSFTMLECPFSAA